MEFILGQYPYYDIQQHLLVGGKANCRLYIEKLGSCLPYMAHYTLSQMEIDYRYLEKEEEV